MARGERLALSSAELGKPAQELARTFVQRWDLHARQLDNGRYVCVHKPLRGRHLTAHLRGDITLGTYVLNAESQARFIVFDADDDHQFGNLLHLARSLTRTDVPVHLESSRRGGHLWLFFDQEVPGRDARAFGQNLMAVHDIAEMELFPKQSRLESGPGSLVRLPFGVHRLTGQRYKFFSPDGRSIAPSIRGQIKVLSTHQRVSKNTLAAYLEHIPSSSPKTIQDSSEHARETLSARIKENISVLDFVSQYVDLKSIGSGALGLCPFHDDHHPSFGVNIEENYWHCFAGCGGGSVIDFWMKWKGCDFILAVNELADILFQPKTNSFHKK
jgi:hypothetical protein